jgi:signal transduction histidine kinase
VVDPLIGRWRARDVAVRDGLLAAALIAAAFVPMLGAAAGPEIADLPVRAADPLAVLLVLAQAGVLAVRRRRPVACLAVAGCAFMGYEILSYPPTTAGVALYLAIYSAAAHQARRRAATAAAATAVYAAFAVVLSALGSPNRAPDFLAFGAFLAVVAAVGTAMRRWRAQESRHRALVAERATAVERARIARELHDVVTHHVTAMVVQADAGQYLVASAPERAAEGLTAISGTGRRALTELRSLLDVLEATGDAPLRRAAEQAPSLDRLRDLARQARAAGQPVELDERGEERPVPVDVELAAYRLVQEALTNAMKYATGRPTVVRVEHDADRLGVEVRTAAGDGPPPTDPGRGGRGLTGLDERVRAVGGTFDAGACTDGGFRVRAAIPLVVPA